MKNYWVYILTNMSNRVLYIGVTNNLRRRVWQHQTGTGSIFTKRYNLTKLVHSEHFTEITAAISREKELKGWRREKKGKLVESHNPDWEDITLAWRE